MQLLHPHMRPAEEIKLKRSDEECLLGRGDFRTAYSSGRLNHDALCKPILAKLACVHPKPNKTAATKEHKAASVLCCSSSAPYLTTALEKSFSPFPKASRKPCRGVPKTCGISNSFSALPHPSTARQGLQGSKHLGGTEQLTNRNHRRACICTWDGFPSRIASGFTFTFSFLPPLCLLCKNASQRLLAGISHLLLHWCTRHFGSF